MSLPDLVQNLCLAVFLILGVKVLVAFVVGYLTSRYKRRKFSAKAETL